VPKRAAATAEEVDALLVESVLAWLRRRLGRD
jgi:hypothetical protein